MEQQHGIQETKEAALAMLEIGQALVMVYNKAMADGKIDMADMGHVWMTMQDAELLAKVKAGSDKIAMVPAEIQDLSLAEGIELARVLIPAVIDAVEAAAKA